MMKLTIGMQIMKTQSPLDGLNASFNHGTPCYSFTTDIYIDIPAA